LKLRQIGYLVNDNASHATGEDPDPVPSTVNASEAVDEVSQLRETLETLRGEIDRYRDEALRARADVDNARKRAQRDVEAAHKFGLERLVEALVPVKDSLDLGLEAAKSATDIKSLQEGMALTQQMFQGALDKLGVTVVDPEGARFDPALHQAMMMEAHPTAPPGSILRVLQRGYCLHERLIRPAMVIVAKAPDGA
jgi:molecular chaperone GrpE